MTVVQRAYNGTRTVSIKRSHRTHENTGIEPSSASSGRSASGRAWYGAPCGTPAGESAALLAADLHAVQRAVARDDVTACRMWPCGVVADAHGTTPGRAAARPGGGAPAGATGGRGAQRGTRWGAVQRRGAAARRARRTSAARSATARGSGRRRRRRRRRRCRHCRLRSSPAGRSCSPCPAPTATPASPPAAIPWAIQRGVRAALAWRSRGVSWHPRRPRHPR